MDSTVVVDVVITVAVDIDVVVACIVLVVIKLQFFPSASSSKPS